MKRILFATVTFALLAQPALAHRLDEYLQAIIFSIKPGQVQATMRLVPGVAVAKSVISNIDSNDDGVLSADEQRAYAQRVLGDLELKEDRRPLSLRLLGMTFPSAEEMEAGTGEMELVFAADLVSNSGTHTLIFENHHQSSISVYLVNSLVPQKGDVQLGTQARNWNQSSYQIEFNQGTPGVHTAQGRGWGGFGAAFRLGLHHIAEGPDHLLFLLTLLLPAPLLATTGRWRGVASVQQSLMHMLGIVTAFTLGHSLTLALAGFGIVHLPSKPVEIFIAISILISAMHALRPLLPGREAIVAAAFGLVHGFAFASALNELGVTGWYRLVSLLGFNLGIEAMQLAVVAVTLPALLLLSRTSVYPMVRIAGAILAIIAACAWMLERTMDKPNAVVRAIEQCAHHGSVLATCLWGSSAVAWGVEAHRRSYAARSSL